MAVRVNHGRNGPSGFKRYPITSWIPDASPPYTGPKRIAAILVKIPEKLILVARTPPM